MPHTAASRVVIPGPPSIAASSPSDGRAAGHLWEVLAPTADPRDPLAGINLFSALPAGPVALEIAAEPGRLRLLARAWDDASGEALAAGLYAAFPQARLVPVAPDDNPARPAATPSHVVDLIRFDGSSAGSVVVRRRARYPNG